MGVVCMFVGSHEPCYGWSCTVVWVLEIALQSSKQSVLLTADPSLALVHFVIVKFQFLPLSLIVQCCFRKMIHMEFHPFSCSAKCIFCVLYS